MMTRIPPPDFYDHSDSDNACFLCGSPNFRPYRQNTHFGFPLAFQRCACGLVKQTPMPNRHFFDWFFNSDIFLSSRRRTKKDSIWGYYDYLGDETCRLASSRARYKRLRKLFPQNRPISILEIGCGSASFLHVANQSGDHAIGCDMSSEFVELARSHDTRIDHGRFEELNYESGQFDMILMLSVMENIPNPRQLLADIHRTLKPGGRFVFNFVDMKYNIIAAMQKERYFLFRPPVTYIYNLGVLEKALGMSGFKIELNLPDIRSWHLEKILTLFGWNSIHVSFRKLRLSRLHFPVYAYPSRVIVASRSECH